MKTNLLLETEKILQEHGKTFNDVTWAGIKGVCKVPLDDFKKAIDEEYDAFAGDAPNVPKGLVVCGKDFYLSRAFNGLFEGWKYTEIPTEPETSCAMCKFDLWRKIR